MLESEYFMPRWTGRENELVPPVNAADVKIAWNLSEDRRVKNPPAIAIGRDFWKQKLSAGADVNAVTYRNLMLSMIWHLCNNTEVGQAPPDFQNCIERLAKWLGSDVLFAVIARIPLQWLNNTPRGFPFDLEELVRQVEQQAA